MKKTLALFEVLKTLQTREVCKDDRELLEKFECSNRTLHRYLEELQESSYSLITIKKGIGKKGRNQECYKLLQISDILKSFLNYSDDLAFFVEISNILNPEAFQKLEDDSKKALTNILNANSDVFYFQNSELEQIENIQIFSKVKKAILEKQLLNFEYSYSKTENLENITPIRIIFSKNNWYFLGFSKEIKPNIRFFRINFLKSLELSEKISEPLSQEVLDFILQIQNPMTLFGVAPKIAILKVNSKIAIYFQEHSKKFLNSQKFLEISKNGDIKIEISYTQPLEILPFIQSWLPNIEILEPQDLREQLFKNLSESLESKKSDKSFEKFYIKTRKKIEKYVSAILNVESGFMGGVGNQIDLIGLEKEKLLEFKNLIAELNSGLHYNPNTDFEKDIKSYKKEVSQLLEYLETFTIQKLMQTKKEDRFLTLEKRVEKLENQKQPVLVQQKEKVEVLKSIQIIKKKIPAENKEQIRVLNQELKKRVEANRNKLLSIGRLVEKISKTVNIQKKAVLQKQIKNTEENLLDIKEIQRKIKLLSNNS